MALQLEPSGETITLEGVSITAPGLSGRVEVHRPGGPAPRAAAGAQPELLAALEGAGVREQLTVEIADPVEHPEAPTVTSRVTDRDEPAISLEVPGPGPGLGQVLLARDEDGVVSWHLPDDIEPAEVAARAGERRTYTVRRRVVAEPGGGPRGLLETIPGKLLKLLVFDLLDDVAGEVGPYFVRRWEAAKRPHRLRELTAENITQAGVPDLDDAGLAALGEGRALLFVHGTASRTHSAFARLPGPVIERLAERYGGRVAGFDHPTIGFSPTENASWLANRLAEAEVSLDVDVVTHSRGGLVARVLAEQPDDADLGPGRLGIGTAVFVATPNAGTVLADFEHLGGLVDQFTNLLGLVPDNRTIDTLEVILTVVKQLAVGALEGLDGLEAMDPDGPYLTDFLNVPSGANVDYRAGSSNFEPAANSPLGRVAVDAASDALFEGAGNDLVVPTEGVYAANGANTFPIADPLLFAAAAAIDHLSFWSEQRLHEALDEWLPG
jgi:hypothetical protein